MLIEAVEPNAVVETDLCVVGGGAVGLSVAHLLEGSGITVSVLEGGGRAYDETSQSLFIGASTGTILPSRSAYLTTSRLRYLGGSTNHWQGFCRPMDALDFEERSWVHGSGWPISLETLHPYYDQAATLAEVEPFARAGEDGDGIGDRAVLPLDSGVETSLFHISPPTRFGELYGPPLEASESCRLHLNANVVEIVTDESGARVEHLEVVGGDEQRYRVRARAFVLAAGAVENARLLLASNRHEQGGVGNRNDLVGRYFMDHPFFDAAFVVLPRRRRRLRPYTSRVTRRPGHHIRAMLRLSDERQRSEQLLNSLIMLEAVVAADAPEPARAIKAMAEDVIAAEIGPPGKRDSAALYAFARVACEQVPDPDSRVTLTDEVDSLGMPRVQLDWRLGSQDAESVRRTMSILANGLGSALRGRGRLLATAEQPWPKATGSAHHLGTTRMNPDPRLGVVDSDCRVHGVANLYVGGSSVYPTAGASNPTLTLLALAARLTEHLRGVLST